MTESPVIRQLREVVGADGVQADPAERLTYECDGFPIARAIPMAVVFPQSTEQVVECIRILIRAGIQVVPRGSGTGLTGACVAYNDGVIVCTSRLRRIREVDLPNRTARVEAGVRNTELTEHVNRLPGGEGLHFAPDPSSQRASTIGGNAATNAGGLHTLKYGVTTNHVLGVEMVMADGSVVRSRLGPLRSGIGPDLAGLACGSEGTLGIITQVQVRLTPRPRNFRTIVGIFGSSTAACQAVADVIAEGIVPAALEMMDGAMVRVVEEAFAFGFPRDAQALLLFELDGLEACLDEQMHRVTEICRANGAEDVQGSADADRRAELWSVRKRAFGAIGRISPSYCTQDACVPRSVLPQVLEEIGRIGERFGLKITSVFHAGDGNVHPILLFDEDDPHQVRTVMQASHAIIEYCIGVGGTITGEHGVGVEKLPLMPRMFDPATMGFFERIKRALDPQEQINAGKLIPSEKVKVDLLAPAAANIPGGAL